MKRLHAIVTGHVQGVFFRDFVRTHAERLQLAGWVRNNADGSVEVVAEGEDTRLQHLALLLEKGPSGAWIEEVRTEYSAPTGEFTDFRIQL
ncbi:MAG: acylphosphatase [Armatimonadota bacterium]